MNATMEPLEPVGIFHTRLQAERARRWLEDEGVAAQLIDLGTGSAGISASLSDAVANREVIAVRLEVASEDLQRARDILAREADENADLPATGITTCPERV